MGERTIATDESKVHTRKGSKPVANTQPIGSTPGKSLYEDIEESGGRRIFSVTQILKCNSSSKSSVCRTFGP